MGRNKRSLEIDSSRVSPPNKMPARSNSNAISDEILNEIKQLQERFSKIEQEVAEITKFVREVTTLRAEVGELRGSAKVTRDSSWKTRRGVCFLRDSSSRLEANMRLDHRLGQHWLSSLGDLR